MLSLATALGDAYYAAGNLEAGTGAVSQRAGDSICDHVQAALKKRVQILHPPHDTHRTRIPRTACHDDRLHTLPKPRLRHIPPQALARVSRFP